MCSCRQNQIEKLSDRDSLAVWLPGCWRFQHKLGYMHIPPFGYHLSLITIIINQFVTRQMPVSQILRRIHSYILFDARAQQQLRWATVATIDMGRKEGLLCPFRGSWDPAQYSVAWAEVYFRTKRRLHPSSHLVTIDTNRKRGAVPLLGGCDPI